MRERPSDLLVGTSSSVTEVRSFTKVSPENKVTQPGPPCPGGVGIQRMGAVILHKAAAP